MRPRSLPNWFGVLCVVGLMLCGASIHGETIPCQQLPLPGLLAKPTPPAGLLRWQVESVWPRGTVNVLEPSPNGEMVAVGGEDKQVRIFAVPSWELRFLLTGHDAAITGFSWSDDSLGLAASDASGIVHRWDVFGRQVPHTHTTNASPITTFSRSPHYRFVTGHPDGTLRQLAPNHPQPLWLTKADRRRVNAVSWDSLGELIASAGDDGKIRLFSRDGVPEHVIAAHSRQAWALDWSPDNQRLVSAASDGTVHIWNRATAQGKKLEATVPRARAVCWNRAGDRFLVAGAGGAAVQVFSAEGELKWTSSGGYLSVNAACWIDKETVLAAGRGGVLYRIRADQRAERLFERRGDYGLTLHVNPIDGRLAMGGRHSLISIWDPDEGRRLRNLNGKHGDVRTVRWRPDGKQLLTAGWNGKARLWRDLANEQFNETQSDGQLNNAAWDPTGKRFALLGQHDRIRICNAAGETIEVWDSGCRGPRSVCWNADGTAVAVTGSAPAVFVRRIGEPKEQKFDLPRGRGVLSWSRDGKWWAVSLGAEIHVWPALTKFDPESAEHRVSRASQSSINRISWSPNNSQIAVGTADGTVTIFRPQDRTQQSLPGHVSMITGLGWSPDGKRLYACSMDQTLRCWTVDDAQPLWTVLIGGPNFDFRFNQDGQPLNYPVEADDQLTCVAEDEDGARHRHALPRYQHLEAVNRFNAPVISLEEAALYHRNLDAVRWEIDFPHQPEECLAFGNTKRREDSIILNEGAMLRRYVDSETRCELEFEIKWPKRNSAKAKPDRFAAILQTTRRQRVPVRVAVELTRHRVENGRNIGTIRFATTHAAGYRPIPELHPEFKEWPTEEPATLRIYEDVELPDGLYRLRRHGGGIILDVGDRDYSRGGLLWDAKERKTEAVEFRVLSGAVALKRCRYRGQGWGPRLSPEDRRRKDALGRKIGDHYRRLLEVKKTDPAKAEEMLVERMEMVREYAGEHSPWYCTLMYDVGRNAFDRSDYGKAERLFVKSEEIANLNAPGFGRSLHWEMLSMLYSETGEFAKRAVYAKKTLDWREKSVGKADPGYVSALNGYGEALLLAKRFEEAGKIFAEAVQVSEELLRHGGERQFLLGVSYSSVADVAEAQGDHERAYKFRKMAHDAIVKRRLEFNEIDPNFVPHTLNLVEASWRVGEWEQGEELVKPLQTRYAAAAKLAALREYMNGSPEAANKRLATHNAVIRNYLHQQLSQLTDAQKFAVSTFGFGREMTTHVGDLLSTMRDESKSRGQEAYDHVLNNRALASSIALEQRNRVRTHPQGRKLLAQLSQARRVLASTILASDARTIGQYAPVLAASARKDTLERQLADLQQQLMAKPSVSTIKLSELAPLIPDGVVVVDFFQCPMMVDPPGVERFPPKRESQYHAFVASKNKQGGVNIDWILLGAAQPIQDAIAAMQKQLRNDATATVQAQGTRTRLRELLWDKVAAKLHGNKTVVIVPDRELCFVPWNALPGAKPGSYLIEDYAITTANSLRQVAALLRDEKPLEGDLVLVGGVDYDGRGELPSREELSRQGLLLAKRSRSPFDRPTARMQWSPLLGAQDEVNAIAGAWSGSEPKLLQANRANELMFRQLAPTARYLHLATHGFFAENAPKKKSATAGEREPGKPATSESGEAVGAAFDSVRIRSPLVMSGVVLAGANLPPGFDNLGLPTGEDGILTGEEVIDLDLTNTELVVLSACETNLGVVRQSDGVFGLQRAFHIAGVRSVIGSLWKVDDDATKTLMIEFYRNLWHKKMSKLEALRQAQLTMIFNYDPKDGVLRGKKTRRTPPAAPGQPKLKTKSLPPSYWAAFTLSGDWR